MYLGVAGRHKRKPPRGMYLDHEDLVTFSGEPEMQSDTVLKGMDGEIVALKRLVNSSSSNHMGFFKNISYNRV